MKKHVNGRGRTHSQAKALKAKHERGLKQAVAKLGALYQKGGSLSRKQHKRLQRAGRLSASF